MANNECLTCQNKRKLIAFNYAGLDIRKSARHAFPERVIQEQLPGDKSKDFLCVDCANNLPITCSTHGEIDDTFSLGVSPQCFDCQSEKSNQDKLKEIDDFWLKNFPEAFEDKRLRLFYLRGALAGALAISDGAQDDREQEAIKKLSLDVTGKNQYGMTAFALAYKARLTRRIHNSDLLDLCFEQKVKKSNLATLKFLLKVAAADGFLDKEEFGFIQKVAERLDIEIPSYEKLADSLGLDLSNQKQEKLLQTTSKIATTIGLGALAVGGFAIDVLLGSGLNKRSKAPKKRESSGSVVNGTGKNCLTCSYWQGRRQTKGGYFITYSKSNDRGLCMVGTNKGREKKAYQSCRGWSKWEQLTKVK